MEEGILPVVFEMIDAVELNDEEDDDEADEDELEEDDDMDDEEELDEEDDGLDALFSNTAVLISTFPALGTVSFSILLLFPPRSITEAEAEADLFRAELSALKRILNISSSSFLCPA